MYILPGKRSLFILLLIISVALPAQVFAQASECNTKRKVSAGALDEPTWKRLNDVYEEGAADEEVLRRARDIHKGMVEGQW